MIYLPSILSANTRKSLIHKVSNISLNVFKSLIKSFGLKPSDTIAIDGSTKYFVSEALLAVLLLKLRFHADDLL